MIFIPWAFRFTPTLRPSYLAPSWVRSPSSMYSLPWLRPQQCVGRCLFKIRGVTLVPCLRPCQTVGWLGSLFLPARARTYTAAGIRTGLPSTNGMDGMAGAAVQHPLDTDNSSHPRYTYDPYDSYDPYDPGNSNRSITSAAAEDHWERCVFPYSCRCGCSRAIVPTARFAEVWTIAATGKAQGCGRFYTIFRGTGAVEGETDWIVPM